LSADNKKINVVAEEKLGNPLKITLVLRFYPAVVDHTA
jgi:hypothetical protein